MSYPAFSLPVRGHRSPLSPIATMGAGMILLVLVVMVSLQLAPSVIEQGRDSGIFAYTGRVVRDGGLPYRDAWDNKPPGVYYIDALAFVLFGVNRWALWLIETISVFLTGWLMYWLLNQVYGNRFLVWGGTLSLVLLTRHPILVEDTNFTEVYALLPQVLCLVAGYQFFRHPRHRWGFLIGLSVGLAFLIKQTTVGVAFTFIPALLISRHPVIQTPRRWTWLGGIIMGGLGSLGVVVAYLLAHGVLLDAIEATFVSPVEFHRWVSQEPVTIWDRIARTFVGSAAPLVVGPLIPFLAVGAVVAIQQVIVTRQHPDEEFSPNATLTIWAALTFVADLALTNMTNRGYGHYYITLLPALTLLLTPSLAVLMASTRQARATKKNRWVFTGLWVYLVAAVAGGAVVGTVVRFWEADWDVTGPTRDETVVDYVIQHTALTDTVLVWGAMTSVNFQSNRLSPTQYHYGYPLIVPEEVYDEDADFQGVVSLHPAVEEEELEPIEEIVADLEIGQPALIVDSTMVDGNRIPPLDPERRQEWWENGGRRDVADLYPIYQFAADHCQIVTEIEEIVIYECTY